MGDIGGEEDVKIPLPPTSDEEEEEEEELEQVMPITQAAGEPGENVEVVPDLFVVNGHPMSFYVAPCNSRPQIHNLILAGGGIVNKTFNPEALTLVEANTDIPSKISGECYSVEFVADAVLEDKLPDIAKYHIKAKRRKTTRRDSLTSPRKRHKFTEEDDRKLARFVRKHADLSASSSVLWKLAEQESLTEGHTWQSMRSRFLKVVQPRLDEQNKRPRSDLGDIDGELDQSLDDIDDDVLAQNPVKKQKLEVGEPHDVYLPPGSVVGYPTDPKETVANVINYLTAATNQPKSVVVHSLIVNSGVVRDALQYLQNPREFCNSKNKSNQIWTHAEDKVLLDKDKRGIMLLERERGAHAIQDRLTFLES